MNSVTESVAGSVGSPRAGRAGRVAAIALVLALALGTGAAVALPSLITAPIGEDGVSTLLLLGSDTGLSRGGSPTSARADAFHLVFVSGDRRHATIVNVPRDSYVSIPGYGTSKINACLVGGPERCVATVESRWNLEVDHYLLTSFDGFLHGMEALGGVRIKVDQPLSDGGADITGTGPQRLSAEQALTYVRDRKHRSDGDFARTAAQAKLLRVLHRQLTTGGPSLRRVTDVAATLRSITLTDMSAGTLLRYGFASLRLPPGNVSSVTLPGSAGAAGGASIVRLSGRADGLVADASDGRLNNR